MTHESRRRAAKNLTRRERRSGITRSSAASPSSASTAVRRSYMAEPTPMDYSLEYSFIRKDLLRILVWATILIAAMVTLSFLPIANNLGQLLG